MPYDKASTTTTPTVDIGIGSFGVVNTRFDVGQFTVTPRVSAITRVGDNNVVAEGDIFAHFRRLWDIITMEIIPLVAEPITTFIRKVVRADRHVVECQVAFIDGITVDSKGVVELVIFYVVVETETVSVFKVLVEELNKLF